MLSKTSMSSAPSIVYFVPTRANLVAVTFDDVPTPGVTDKLLAMLASRGSKATFFMVGEVALKNRSLAKEVADAGHDVGIHSHRHRRGMKEWSAQDILDDFSRAKDAVESATGRIVKLARPPFGNVCPAIIDACSTLGLMYVGWSVNSKDWVGGLRGDLGCCDRGSIVLFHDGGRVSPVNADRTVSLVESLLGNWRGLSSATVTELSAVWDDSLVSNDGGIRLMGWNVLLLGDSGHRVHFYWHPDDILAGLSYGVDLDGKRVSIDVPPMSNVDDWIRPIEDVASMDSSGGFSLGKVWSARYNGGVKGTKINLGCGTHVLEGWDNFDTGSRAQPPVRTWEWNMPLPYADGTVDAVLVQHSLQHCLPDDYDRNFSEIRRVLKSGGKFVLKEADNRNYVWHKPGSTDSDGYIASSISLPEAIEVMSRNGFSVSEDRQAIVGRWGDVINRQRRVLRGHNLFVIEGTRGTNQL